MEPDRCNALDVLGVWSPGPLTVGEQQTLQQFQAVPGTQKIFAPGHAVEEWTAAAMATCKRFRETVTAFLDGEKLAIHATADAQQGHDAFCDSCRVLL